MLALPAELVPLARVVALVSQCSLGEKPRDGAGWGTFLSHVAASRGAEGIGVTLSRTQEAHANRRFAELGVEHQARAILADYRDLPADKFDRIV